MDSAYSFSPPSTDYDAERALRFPIGVASPLWLTFGAAAGMGAAWWWMTAWTRMSILSAALEPTNLEAALAPQMAAAEAVAQTTAAVVETSAEVVEEMAEPVTSAFEPVEEVSLDTLEAGDIAVETGAPPPAESFADESAEVVETAADAVSEAAEVMADATAQAVDDFTRLVGVGPRLAQALAARGVRTFADIAAWTDDDLAAVDRDLDLKGRAVRDAWVVQAKRFAEAAIH
ncbi:helix-hairpin-helix domain-containing protein [Caulobacter sp. NIBR2454]|uniref:helix-hairpin-helix domain-containing protein n=1 Tax=Caulobacter sp. NIBR2454 TaxID=3015996 RepID=UPI0022B6119B|nr:helix-hairpin-helix domain-containing protein [Caulobacter sp. NIBR2454]